MRRPPLKFQVTVLDDGRGLYDALVEEANGRRKSAEIQRLANGYLAGQTSASNNDSTSMSAHRPAERGEGGNHALAAFVKNIG